MRYQLTVPDPVNGKPRLRSTEYWKRDALMVAQETADRMGVPVTVQQIRTRGGVPKLITTVHPQAGAPVRLAATAASS